LTTGVAGIGVVMLIGAILRNLGKAYIDWRRITCKNKVEFSQEFQHNNMTYAHTKIKELELLKLQLNRLVKMLKVAW